MEPAGDALVPTQLIELRKRQARRLELHGRNRDQVNRYQQKSRGARCRPQPARLEKISQGHHHRGDRQQDQHRELRQQRGRQSQREQQQLRAARLPPEAPAGIPEQKIPECGGQIVLEKGAMAQRRRLQREQTRQDQARNRREQLPSPPPKQSGDQQRKNDQRQSRPEEEMTHLRTG